MSSPDKIKPLLKNSLGVIINTAFRAVHSRRPVTLKQNVKQSLWLGADFFLPKSGFFHLKSYILKFSVKPNWISLYHLAESKHLVMTQLIVPLSFAMISHGNLKSPVSSCMQAAWQNVFHAGAQHWFSLSVHSISSNMNSKLVSPQELAE